MNSFKAILPLSRAAFFVAACIACGMAGYASASSHSFTVASIEQGIAEKTHLAPSDKFSVTADGVSALVEYKGVTMMSSPDDYAIVIHVKRW